MGVRVWVWTVAIGLAVGRVVLAEPVIPQEDRARQYGEIVVTDITDPDNPIEVGRGGNVVLDCGLKNFLARAMVGLNLQNSLGDQPPECSGNDANNYAVQNCTYDWGLGRILIGAGGAGCTGVDTPWRCCTGTGSCVERKTDTLLFAMGQEESGATKSAQQAAYEAWVNAGKPNVTYLSYGESDMEITLDATNHIVTLRIRSVAESGIGNGHQWCEWALTSDSTQHGCGWVKPGTSDRSGWLLNHGVFSPCLTKSPGQVWLVDVRINFDL